MGRPRGGAAPRAWADGPDALCYLGFTSGTTGEPKGAMHTSETLVYAVEALAKHLGDDALGRADGATERLSGRAPRGIRLGCAVPGPPVGHGGPSRTVGPGPGGGRGRARAGDDLLRCSDPPPGPRADRSRAARRHLVALCGDRRLVRTAIASPHGVGGARRLRRAGVGHDRVQHPHRVHAARRGRDPADRRIAVPRLRGPRGRRRLPGRRSGRGRRTAHAGTA